MLLKCALWCILTYDTSKIYITVIKQLQKAKLFLLDLISTKKIMYNISCTLRKERGIERGIRGIERLYLFKYFVKTEKNLLVDATRLVQI